MPDDLDAMFEEIQAKHDAEPWFKKAYWALLRLKDRSQPIRGTKWRFERAKRGYSESDVWSFDDHLARVIAGGCRHLIVTSHGYPMFPEESGAIEKAISEYAETDAQGVARWNNILDEIATGFEGYIDAGDAQSSAFKRAMELFAQHFPNLWD